MDERVEEIRRRMKEIGTVFIQDGNGYHIVPGQEEAASFLADAAWTLSGALAQAEREREELTRLVKEWVCEQCKQVYPPELLLPGFKCIICRNCGGETMPYPRYEWKLMRDERDAARAEVERLREECGRLQYECDNAII